MLCRWNNGFFHVGYLPYMNAYGVELAWGRRDLLEGRTIDEGDRIFADYRRLIVADAIDVVRANGSLAVGMLRHFAKSIVRP